MKAEIKPIVEKLEKLANLKKQFRIEHPETIGEKDRAFDDSNYMDWLELKFLSHLEQEGSMSQLPSDEEIKSAMESSWEQINYELKNQGGVNPHAYDKGFKTATKWLLNRIKEQGK